MGECRRGKRGVAIAAWALTILTKPGIAGGVALAGLAGMVMARRGLPSPSEAALLTACILAAAGGSALLNAVLEKDTDALMPRVAGRSDALRRLGKGRAALLSTALVAASSALSFIFINSLTGLLILLAAVSYAGIYTSFKKRSPYGTVLGAVPGALPVLIGYASAGRGIGMDGAILFLLMLMWQPPHFLALALKLKDEYRAAGLPVMPVALGEPYTKAFSLLYATALPPIALSLWALGYSSVYFALFSLFAGALFLAAYYMDIVRLKRYGRAFAASIVYITAMLVAVVVDAASY